MRLFLVTTLIYATACYSQKDAEKKWGFKISPSFGTMNSHVRYSISGNINGQNPNVLSELIWKDLKSVSYGLKASIVNKKRFNIAGSYHIADAYKGKVSDTDYSGDDRTGISSEQYFSSHKGINKTLNAELGYNIKKKGNTEIIPSINFISIFQKSYLLNGKQGVKINGQYVNVEGLNSYYVSKWKAIGLGINVKWYPIKQIELKSAIAYHYGIYNGYGRWNLRQDFRQPNSYTHNGYGNIFIANFTLSYFFNTRMAINSQLQTVNSKTKDGTDVLYYANGSSVKTNLNEATLRYVNLSLGFSYSF